MININNAVLQFGSQILLEDTSLMIHSGQKVGVVGRNGCGKTSLYACINGTLSFDRGSLSLPADLRISYMRQETSGSDKSAVDFVIDGDRRYRELQQQLEQAEKEDDQSRLAKIHSELDSLNGYTVRHRAELLLSGLGFKSDDFDAQVSSFSGGWRVRLNLAAALMCPSDLLLLDEPTNHLDLEATIWLEQWLIRYPGTLLIISHDRAFLDKIVAYVISFENRKLRLYKGNYSAFEKQRGERLALEKAMAEKQQRRRAEIENFVRRFRAKASKAKQAQSRLKELQRMQEIELAHIDSPLHFQFSLLTRLPDYLLTLSGISIGYDQPLVENITFNIQSSTRIGLLGFNGSGKSTFLKVLAGELKPLAGEMTPSKHLKVGYFAQHQVDVLDGEASPMELLQSISPTKTEQQLRDYLGGFDFRGERAEFPIANFSGGEKVRLALAAMVWRQPNLLLLDEPTNHLDLEMRQALTVALQGFNGAVIVISHDRHLLGNTVDNFYSIHDGKWSNFDGDLGDYESWVRSTSSDLSTLAGKSENSLVAFDADRLDKKSKRKLAAARRKQLAPMRNRIAGLEKEIEKLSDTIQEINEQLANQELYSDENKSELNKLLREQGAIKTKLEGLEEQWLSLHEEIEIAERTLLTT